MSDEFDRPEIRPGDNGLDHGWQAVSEDDLAAEESAAVGGPASAGDRRALNADDVLEPDATGRGADSTGDATGGGRGNRGGRRDEWVETFDRVDRLDLDSDGGTPVAGPEERTDVGNLRGGQRDAATGGSDLGATTGGGDTGAV